jgi:SAM-dependent methyltransferase
VPRSNTSRGLVWFPSALAIADGDGLLARSRSITHDVGTVESLQYRDNSFDLVVANHLLNDLPDLSRPISEFTRVLRSGGRLVALFLHPCFYLPKGERAEPSGVDPAKYFKRRSIDETFVVSGQTSPSPVSVWFRPLEDYFKEFHRNGLVIISLSEPHPLEEQLRNDPWWNENFRQPMFLLVTAMKV